MKNSRLLTITSLLLILLFTFHLTDDIVHGFEPGGLNNLIGGTAILVVLLFGTLVLTERLAGYIITLLGGLLAFGVAGIHMNGAGVGGEFAKSNGAYFFIWTLLALGLTGIFSVILSVRGLWSPQWGKSRSPNNSDMEGSS